MGEIINVQSVATALLIAIILAFTKLFRDVDQIKIRTEPILEWWKKTSIDALKIATNPTSQRLTELAEKFVACVNGKSQMTTQEKQELIDGLREVMNDKRESSDKRQSASMSLRFIETREGLSSRAANSGH